MDTAFGFREFCLRLRVSRRPWCVRIALRAWCLGVAAALFAVPIDSLAAPVPTLVDRTAVVPNGLPDGTTALRVLVTGLEGELLTQADVIKDVDDLGAPFPADVKRTDLRELPRPGKDSRTWVVVLSVRGLPLTTTQNRTLSLAIAGTKFALPYELTNSSSSQFRWKVTAASPTVTIAPDERIPIAVAILGPVPATKVQVFMSSIVAKDNKQPISPTGLTLSRSATGRCEAVPLDMLSYEVTTLWLCGPFRHGRYEGAVTLSSAESPQSDVAAFTVNCTDLITEFFGVITILVGVLLGWFVTVFAKNIVNRDQLLLPVVRLKVNLSKVDPVLATLPQDLTAPVTTKRVADVRSDLAVDRLEEIGLPTRMPSPWPSTIAGTTLDTYKKYVQDKSDWVTAIVCVGDWLATAAKRSAVALLRSKTSAVGTAVQSIDQVLNVGTAPTADIINARCDTIIATLDAALNPPPAGAPVPGPPPRALGITAESLHVEIALLSAVAWTIYGLATSLVGSYVLIFSPSAAGFGAPLDFLVCLIWGCGFSAGSSLMQATPATVSTTFGLAR